MTEDQKQQFQDIFDGLAEYYGVDVPSKGALGIMWGALRAYRLEDVQAGAQAHVAAPGAGKWMPRAADIVEQIKKANAVTRIGPDEAWAKALNAEDERNTVVWTDEIAEAFAAARPLLEDGDRVGARMAFKQCYERLTAGKAAPPRVTYSVGWDRALRAEAFEQAKAEGLLPAPQADALMLQYAGPNDRGTPGEAVGKLLTNKPLTSADKETGKRMLERLHSAITDSEGLR